MVISLLLVGLPTRVLSQNWDDVAFWTADFALNTLQREAAARELEEYRKTYLVLRDGYLIVRGLVDDNHKLHKEFFDQLASINPVVKNYHKVGQITMLYSREITILGRDAPRLVGLLHNSDAFTTEELEQVQRVFDGMLDRIYNSIDELILVALDGSQGLEMMDSERIVIIDRLYEESVQIVSSFREFRQLLLNLAAQRTDTTVSNLENLFRVRP